MKAGGANLNWLVIAFGIRHIYVPGHLFVLRGLQGMRLVNLRVLTGQSGNLRGGSQQEFCQWTFYQKEIIPGFQQPHYLQLIARNVLRMNLQNFAAGQALIAQLFLSVVSGVGLSN